MIALNPVSNFVKRLLFSLLYEWENRSSNKLRNFLKAPYRRTRIYSAFFFFKGSKHILPTPPPAPRPFLQHLIKRWVFFAHYSPPSLFSLTPVNNSLKNVKVRICLRLPTPDIGLAKWERKSKTNKQKSLSCSCLLIGKQVKTACVYLSI